jgi:hypothetical protein
MKYEWNWENLGALLSAAFAFGSIVSFDGSIFQMKMPTGGRLPPNTNK